MAFNFSGIGTASSFPQPSASGPATSPATAGPHSFSNAARFHSSHNPSSARVPTQPSVPPHFSASRAGVPHSNPPTIDPALSEDEVPARFIDTLANQFGFGDAEQDLRRNLHGFAKMAHGLSKPDIATRTYLLAAIFNLIKENRAMTSAHRSTQALLTDLQTRLEVTFALTPEQKANVRIIAGDLIFDCSRIKFMTMYFDVEAKIQQGKKDLKFENIYGSPSREKILMMHIKRQCSSIRNVFREMLRDSVIGDSTSTLSDFLFESASRFKLNGVMSGLGPAYTARIAILRRFAYEHPDLLDREEDEEDGTGHMPDDITGETTRSSAAEPARKKRKRGGRTAKGEDFWSQVEKWFDARKDQWGDSWTSAGWSAYIAETIAKDQQRYKAQVIQNPFMEDVTIDEAYLSGSGDIVRSNVAGFGAVDDLLYTL